MKSKASHYATPIPALDGIRAIAVIMVVLSHSGFGKIVPGGLGVTIFFFLSGFLITTLLCKENDLKSRINVKAFYTRRFLRLFPPLLVCLCIAYLLVFAGVLGGNISLTGFLAQILYFANYYILFFNPEIPNGTGILWSLAVEEHYYIFFPLIAVPLFKRLKYNQAGVAFFVLCAVVLCWRILLMSWADLVPDRIYLASDTRFDSILFGAVLALIKNPVLAIPEKDNHMQQSHWIVLSLGLIGILISIFFRNEFFRETFRYTLQGIALMPLFYCAIRFPDSVFFKFLNTLVFRRIGILSYSIYLIHLIVMHLLEKNLAFALPPLAMFVAVLSISILYALLVEKYIDTPLFAVRSKIH